MPVYIIEKKKCRKTKLILKHLESMNVLLEGGIFFCQSVHFSQRKKTNKQTNKNNNNKKHNKNEENERKNLRTYEHNTYKW